MDRVSIERMCAGKEFQVKGADTENAREEKLLVIPAGLVRRFVLEERNDLGEGGALAIPRSARLSVPWLS